MKRATIEKDLATVMDDASPYVSQLLHSEPRDAFLTGIGLTLDANVKQVSYEPQHSLYHVLTTDGLIVCATPAEHPALAYIDTNFSSISAWMADAYLLASRPSPYHYFEDHQWKITPAAQDTLTQETTRNAAKATRSQQVELITVTTQAGNTFDGDETSQTRMARAIIALGTGLAPSVNWVLADNSVINATAAELTEALALAGAAQAAIWVVP